MFLFVNTYFSFSLVILEFTLIKPWNKITQAYSASVTGVLKTNPLTSKATSIHPSGHVSAPCQCGTCCQGWRSEQQTPFFMAMHTGALFPLRILVILFLPLLGSESREGWQEGKMNPQIFSLLWALQSTPSQCIEHLHLVFCKIYTLLLGEVSAAYISLWAPDQRCPQSVPGIIKSWSTCFWSVLNQLQIQSLGNERFPPHAVFSQFLT